MMKTRLLTLLALLMTAATGAWADDNTVTWDNTNVFVVANQSATVSKWDNASFTYGGVTIAFNGTSFTQFNLYGPTSSAVGYGASLTVWGADGDSFTFTAPTGKVFSRIEIINADQSYNFTAYGDWAWDELNNKIVWSGTPSSTVTLGGSNLTAFNNLQSIVFTFAGGSEPAGYTVSMKDGVKDADKWTVKVGEGQAQALPIGGLKGDGSETVTLQYNGRLKVKGVKATSDAAPAKTPATVTTAPTGAAIVGVGKTTALVSGGVADGGTLMYAVTTTNTKPTSTAGFSATVPTAQTITASGKVYVWYYVKADDTHTDSEIAATAIEVPVADIVWTSSDMTSNFYAQFDGWSYNNTHQGITVTASGSANGGWAQNSINVNDGSGTITFTSSVGNIKSIVITAVSLNNINEMNAPTGWTANEMWNEPRTLSWSGTASATVNLPLSNMQNIGDISTIVFMLE